MPARLMARMLRLKLSDHKNGMWSSSEVLDEHDVALNEICLLEHDPPAVRRYTKPAGRHDNWFDSMGSFAIDEVRPVAKSKKSIAAGGVSSFMR